MLRDIVLLVFDAVLCVSFWIWLSTESEVIDVASTFDKHFEANQENHGHGLSSDMKDQHSA